jgi:hypothetical protein
VAEKRGEGGEIRGKVELESDSNRGEREEEKKE